MKIRFLTAMTIMAAAAIQLAPLANGEEQKGQGEGRRQHRGERFGNLAPEERQKMQAAHEKAMQDPAVKAAHDKMQQARREFRETMHAAMLKADASIQPILNKMPKHERGGKGGKGDQDDDD